MTPVDLRRPTAICSTALLALGFLMLLTVGCRQPRPVTGHSNDGTAVLGTLSGTIRGPEGSGSIEGRTVEVINIDTYERHRITTSNAGEFTINVKPGKYRVQVALHNGESLIKQPGVVHVSRAETDAHADIVIESVRVARPRYRMATPVDPALGSPIV